MAPGGQGSLHTRAKEILAYFLRNPRAADSLEGVARWRVQQEAIHQTVEHVSQALAWLVELGFLLEEHRPGVAPLFRLNRSKAAEATQFLEAPPRPAGDTTLASSEGRMSTGIAQSALMLRAFDWINAVLLRYLRENPALGGDIPGLTRSHSSVESLLLTEADGQAESSAERRATSEAALALTSALEQADDAIPLAALYRNLRLTWLELQALLLCFAPECDIKYQSVYGVLHDDLGRRTATFGLLSALLGKAQEVRSPLERSGGLTRWRLLESGSTLPHADEPLRIDTSVVSWLFGNETALLNDPTMRQWIQEREWPGGTWVAASGAQAWLQRLQQLFAASDDQWIAVAGEDLSGARATVEAVASDAGISIVRVVLPSEPPTDPLALDDVAARLTRAILLRRAVPIMDAGDAPAVGTRSRSHARLAAALTVGAPRGVIVAADAQSLIAELPHERCQVLHCPAPTTASIAAVFSAAAADAGLLVNSEQAEQLAMAYPLSIGEIDDAVLLTVSHDAGLASPDLHFSALSAACRRIASSDLPRFAQRVEPLFRLDDVVLPSDRRDQLREMVAHVRCAYHVLHTWGFDQQMPYGRGVAALFCGPSGTGKTMAAQAIARELNTEAYVVDLSRVVSKYIGESEKNLDAVFSDAERAGAVLLFDEADALFGKRSEIKDAHDRYANIEVAYLLQRMEAYGGLAILTTNFRRNMDDAFLRRLRFIVEFPKPDAEARETIWRQCLPASAPVAKDVNVRLLARRLELTGGNIRQITLRAAFAAAAERVDAIAMRHVLSATRAELLRLGMSGAERDIAELDAAQRRVVPRVA